MIQRPSWFLGNIKQKPSLWTEKSKTDVSLEKWCTAERGDRKPNNGIRSAAKGRVDRCPARAAAAVSAADPTFRAE